MRSIAARVGTEKTQVGILQLATVKPQPHWQVRPSETSEFVVVSDANVSRETFFSSGERKTNIAAARNTSDKASVNLARTDSITSGRGVGEFARVGGRAAERGCDCGALTHVRPHHDHRAQHHHQAAGP